MLWHSTVPHFVSAGFIQLRWLRPTPHELLRQEQYIAYFVRQPETNSCQASIANPAAQVKYFLEILKNNLSFASVKENIIQLSPFDYVRLFIRMKNLFLSQKQTD
jgi:hypothetical protein